MSGVANAKLAGKNVILVHGFQAGDLGSSPSISQQQANSNNYWSAFWGARAEGQLVWSSADRVTGGIKDAMRRQIKALENARTCANGCVFVTHSTGDLVLRDALTRLNQWGVNQNNFKVLVVLDLAGAGGGTELANIAVNIANGSGVINAVQRAAINTFLGFNPNPNTIGVLTDLRPGTARSIATQNNSVPRLRFAGTGTQFLGVTRPFLLGKGDSVVPLHSACGARFAQNFESCSRSVRNNGVIRSSRGPSSLYFNHFPVLMGESVDHEEARNNKRPGGVLTTVVNNVTRGGINVDFATSTNRRWWAGFRRVRTVDNGGRRSFSANIFNTLNN